MPGINDKGISAIPVEIFAAYIVEKLRRSNPHLAHAFDESRYVLGGAVVHIPQAGVSPNVVKNRKVFPSTAVQRGDSSISYALDVYTTDPTHISWHEGAEISYEKTDSVLADHVGALVESCGDNMIYNWLIGYKRNALGAYVADVLPLTNRIATSGTLAAVNPNDGQTGTRKAFIHQDLSKAQSVMNKQNVPKNDRFAMLESYMYQQLLDSLTDNQMGAYQAGADMKNGIVGKLYGFNIMERSSVLAFDATNVPILPGVALDGNSNLASLCWQKDCVTKSTGDIKPFDDRDNPMYYGDIFSALLKYGGRARREDWKGVLAIVQTSN